MLVCLHAGRLIRAAEIASPATWPRIDLAAQSQPTSTLGRVRASSWALVCFAELPGKPAGRPASQHQRAGHHRFLGAVMPYLASLLSLVQNQINTILKRGARQLGKLDERSSHSQVHLATTCYVQLAVTY